MTTFRRVKTLHGQPRRRMNTSQAPVLFIELEADVDSDGMFVITSPQLPGFVVIHHDLRLADKEMPELLAVEIKSRLGKSVYVARASKGPSETVPLPPWAAIPAAVAAKAMEFAAAGDD